jgi:sporulation protein YlmC with PRC-barrel domain
MQRNRILITTAIVLPALALPAAAAEQKQSAQDKIDLTTWSQKDLYQGWTLDQLMDTAVYGTQGEDIGEIENLVINADGKITKVIVEAGGFLDIGDTHFAVPWDEVQMSTDNGLQSVTVPVDEDNVANFSLFDDDTISTGERAWKASELLNDYVTLEEGLGYGMVRDLIFSRDGQIEAVVVYPDVTYGMGRPYAYPYYGYNRGFDPGADTYALPYTQSEVAELGPFDYSSFEMGRPGTQGETQETEGQG